MQTQKSNKEELLEYHLVKLMVLYKKKTRKPDCFKSGKDKNKSLSNGDRAAAIAFSKDARRSAL